MDITVNLFTTEWVLSIFLSLIPIELSNIYLDKFFERGWEVFYRVAIEVVRYFQKSLLLSQDPAEVIGLIKQARRGCEHLLMIQSESTEASRKMNKLKLKQIETEAIC